MRTITLKCPSCGAKLEVSEDMTRFACGSCGTEQIVERRGGTVSLRPIMDAIAKVQTGTTGTDRTVAELALRRLNEEWAAACRKEAAAKEELSILNAIEPSRFDGVFYAIGVSIVAIIVGYIISTMPQKDFPEARTVSTLAYLCSPLSFPILIFLASKRRDEWKSKADKVDARIREAEASQEQIARKIAENRKIVDG